MPPAEILGWAVSTFGKAFAIATSFQKEGMVLIDMAAARGLDFRVFTLETGRLPAATLAMIGTVRERYGIPVEIVRPDEAEVAAMVARHGPDLFYASAANRRLCCEIRKVRPLERKLRELQAWATGLRREQSAHRSATPLIEHTGGKWKINPLAAWTAEEVERYTCRHRLPVHPLYAEGFASIGCEPCTRPILPGEEERAGRWWWERELHKECGIHVSAEALVRRA